MKVLIISNPSADRKDQDRIRFSRMSETLVKAGFSAEYRMVASMDSMKSTITDYSPDIVYCADYYLPGNSNKDESVHEYLEKTGIPFIGSRHAALERVLAKSEIKETWKFLKISTPAFCRIPRDLTADRILEGFYQTSSFPYILKPNKEGNSRGLDETSIVYDKSSLSMKLEELYKTYDEVLVEEFFGDRPDIREFTVAMIGNQGHRLLMPAEITLLAKKEHRLVTTDDKDMHRTKAVPVTDAKLHSALVAFARKAFNAAEMMDYSRCDILMTGGQFYAIEINGLPMIPDKWFEVCSATAGLDSEQYPAAIIMAGIVRNIRSGRVPFMLTDEMMRAFPRKIWRTLCEDHASFSLN